MRPLSGEAEVQPDTDRLHLDFSSEPLAYPGPMTTESVVVLPGCAHSLIPRPGRRLGQSRVIHCAECEAREHVRETTINYELLTNNAANVDSRFPVVAVGSNASPAIMRGKMQKAGLLPIMPFVTATLTNIQVGYSAHVARAGYLPAAPFAAPGDKAQVVVGWLDYQQLIHLDSTEPNYDRRLLSSADYPLTLDGGEQLGNFYIYVSKWGLIAEPPTSPVLLHDQETIAGRLARAGFPPWLGQEPSEAARLLADSLDGRNQARSALATAGWATAAAITWVPDTLQRYGDISSKWFDAISATSVGLPCSGTSDGLDREGQQCVVLHPEDASALALPSGVAHAVATTVLSPLRPGLVVRVVRDPDQSMGRVGLDQVVRNSLGIERGENACLSPVVVPSTPVTDLLLARPHYIVCRVQSADLATVEQDVALLAPLAMNLLGVNSGSRIVIDGVAPAGERSPNVKIRVHEAPQEVLDLRQRLNGGDIEARFPSSRDALGVFPDLPWLFLDAATRTRLGLGSHKICAVRVRASRRDQLVLELRELLLLFVLAAVGLASLVTSAVPFVIFIVLLGIASLGLARSRLRSRLGASRSISSE